MSSRCPSCNHKRGRHAAFCAIPSHEEVQHRAMYRPGGELRPPSTMTPEQEIEMRDGDVCGPASPVLCGACDTVHARGACPAEVTLAEVRSEGITIHEGPGAMERAFADTMIFGTGAWLNKSGEVSTEEQILAPIIDKTLEIMRRGYCDACQGFHAYGACPNNYVPRPHLPESAAERKAIPIATGFMDYFPDAIAAVAALSKIGNDQHNPGKPLHWDRSKSTDEADTLMRHFLDRGLRDTDGVRHSTKVAWRALALLQKEIEAEGGADARGSQGDKP